LLATRRQALRGIPGLSVTIILGSALAQPASPGGTSALDVKALFAGNCGFCHSDGGRAAGRGPQLLDTKRSDEFIRDRIKNGKEGAMPAFGQMFNDADIDAIIDYIRHLLPEGQG
jgi:mono/diheme cytochrome c family protein